jgi:putative phosphoribosyl transferase
MKSFKHIIKNRQDAADKLLEILPLEQIKDEKWNIIAISNGGLELASFINSKINNNLDMLFLEPITAPHNKTCEIAMVSETDEIVIHEELIKAFEIQYDYIYGEANRKHEEKILSYIYKYRKGKAFSSIKDEVVLLVDDGSESGLKFMTALKTVLSMKPKAVYIAVGVLPNDVLELLKPFADDVFFLYAIDDYVQTSLYYEELEEIDEEKIEKYLGEQE